MLSTCLPALSETWLSSNITDNKISIPEYTLARTDRSGSAKLNGGGVLFYIRENIPVLVKNELAANNEELLWIEVNRPKCKPLLIAAACKPPDMKETDFIDSLRNSFANIDF